MDRLQEQLRAITAARENRRSRCPLVLDPLEGVGVVQHVKAKMRASQQVPAKVLLARVRWSSDGRCHGRCSALET
jgi:hypothetical protein